MNIEGYSIIESIVFMIFDSILYYLLGRYFDQVIPKEYGLTQPWYFLFTKAYWRGEMVQTKHTPIDHSKDERYKKLRNEIIAIDMLVRSILKKYLRIYKH